MTRNFNRSIRKLLLSIIALQINLSQTSNDHLDSTTTGIHQIIHNRQIQGTTEVTIPIKDHSIYPPFVDTNLRNRWFEFGGSTIINTNQHIRLTQDRPSEAGYLWSRTPLTATSFQVEIEFKIDGKSSSVYGDGMAVWLSKPSFTPGPVFGSTDKWDGFGIFIDTFPNSRHSYSFPRILGMMNQGYRSYDVGNDGDGQESAACSHDVRRSDVSTRLRINYVQSQFLEVLLQYDKWDEWEHCFTVSNYTLPKQVYLGFSAHTGEVSDAHDILSISTNGLVYHPPNSRLGSKPQDKKLDWDHHTAGGIGSGALGFWGSLFAYLFWILKWAFVLGCIGLAVFGGKKYFSQYQQHTMKKF